jgi:MazG family protein
MKKLDQLCATIKRLMGPDGCPWDQKQTLESLLPCLIEETAEVVEAVHEKSKEDICEEIGDLLFVCIFFCKVAEKEGAFSLEESLEELNAKLIRRHPHVFADEKAENIEEVLILWEEVKRKEKLNVVKKINIPHTLPSLSRAVKLAKYLRRNEIEVPIEAKDPQQVLAKSIWELCLKAQSEGLDPEIGLRQVLSHVESVAEKQQVVNQ